MFLNSLEISNLPETSNKLNTTFSCGCCESITWISFIKGLLITRTFCAVAVFAMIIELTKYIKKPELQEPKGLGKVLANKWYVDEIYDTLIVKPIGYLGSFFKNIIEKSGIDGFVNGIGTFIQYSSRRLRLVQNGKVGTYIMFMVFSILVLWLVFWNQADIINFFQKIF